MAERPALVAVTALPDAGDPLPLGAALAVATAARADGAGVVLLDAGLGPVRRPTILSSRSARELERRIGPGAAARGTACWVRPGHDGLEATLDDCLGLEAEAVVAVLAAAPWRELVDAHRDAVTGVLVAADLPRQRALAGLLAAELIPAGVRLAVSARSPGAVSARRALAGIDPGGELGLRARRWAGRLCPSPGPAASRQRSPGVSRRLAGERGQALPLVLGAALALVLTGVVLTMLGVAATGASRVQRAADLAAVSAARSLRDDHARLFVPARLARGAPNPRHLSEPEYRARAAEAARDAAAANGLQAAAVHVSFPGAGFAPTRVRVELAVSPARPTGGATLEASARAEAEAYPAASGFAAGQVSSAGENDYDGLLVERQGERMRPDVARAFDRLTAAAATAGHPLVVNSAFRSDAEQAALFAANPDPRWVAPPGTSLHRCATELDLGPATAYGWLAGNARRFGFLKRYPWEAWHFGFVAGPAPCSLEGNRLGRGAADGELASTGLPSFVPARFRRAISAAASRWNVSAALLSAQLLAESNFNPFAVSPAGARGIAQFMPATAAAYGLDDPFEPAAAIDAQARLMADLLGQFDGSIELALAAYNAGPGAVGACGCVPPYPETQAYVARILGLLGGAGAIAPPELEVRLVA